MKRLISFLLTFAILIGFVPAIGVQSMAAQTGNDGTIQVEEAYAEPGGTVTVNISVKNNPGILGMTLKLTYDESKVTLVSVANGEAFSYMTFTTPKDLSSGCKLPWAAEVITEEDVVDGVIATLTFEVAEGAAPNELVEIGLSYEKGAIIDNDLIPLNPAIVNGLINIIDYTPGDLNEDGYINTTDVVYLMRYIAGGYNVTINESAADVNDDGNRNTTDVVYIMRFIAGGYGVGLKPSTPKCVHAMQATPAKAATCTEAGNSAYWYCAKCQKHFGNEAGTVEIVLADTIQEKLGHNVVTVPGYPATKTAPGLTDGKACDRDGCDYVEVEQEEIPIITGYQITYEIANGEDYIEKNAPVIPADKMQYFSDTGLDLPQLRVAGYRFIGWSYSQASSDNIITKIPAGETGDKELYAHWSPIVYTVTFDSPDVPVNGTKITGETILNATEYTVDKGKDLPVPTIFGYTFVGWSDDNGFIVNRIKPGTTGHMTLRANWTSDRNKATSYQEYGEPIIIEDDVRGQFLFVYNIGKIDNVPLNEVEFIGKSEGLNYKKEVNVVDTVDENYVEEINKMISNATTKSSGWTLSTDWNDLYSIEEETGTLSGYSDERTTTDGKTVGGKYFVSNSEGGSSHVSTESGSSSSSSSKVTTEDSFGINGSYDNTTEKYCDAKLGVTNETELSAGVKVKYGPAEASAGVKNTTTVSAETSAGRKDTTSVHVDSSVSSFVGTVNTHDSSSYFNSAISNDSNWNTTNSYESSNELFQENSVKNTIEEQLSKKSSLNMSKALGGSNSDSKELSEQNRTDEEYNTRLTYSKGTQVGTKKYLEFTSSETGYYRIITAGTVHVFGVVGYDVATSSYFTYCYNVLDDTTREIVDFSKDNMNFDDCQNGIVTFDIPYEVNEYISGVMGMTDGLETDYAGRVNNFVPTEDFLPTMEGDTVIDEGFNGTVVIPQYVSKNNQDGTYSAVKVTSLSSDAFDAVKEDIRIVVLPIYITEIPDYAFEGCTNLETVIAYGVTSIGDYAFKGCTSLEKFYVDNKITHLGEKAFENVPEVAIAAYDSAVADAAITCGAKNITLNVSYVKDKFENKVIEVADTTENFTLIGNGSTYNNIQIDSKATESTMISNMVFANNKKTPIKIASKAATLARVTVENSPSFALILTGDNVNVKLLGDVKLNSSTENAVLSRSVVLSQSQQDTTSKMIVNGKYLTCGEVVNDSYLNVKPTVISADDFANYLVSCIVTFNPNGGTVGTQSVIAYEAKPYGQLPVPERQYFAFEGWYTAAEGGELVTAETVVDTVVNHTLYAHWRPITATLSFNANGGQVGTTSKLVYLGEKVGTLPTPTRTHYTFKGWYTAATGGTKITADSVLTVSETKTVYAQWDIVPYKVSWNTGTGYSITVKRTSSPNAGAATGTLSNGATIYYGDVLSITYTASTGYTLGGKGKTSITVSGNVTSADIYTSATVNSYTATWTGSGTGYSITVKRTSSPLKGAATGTITSGTTVYYNDVLSVTYTASTGYSITKKGSTSITVTGNVTSSAIYAEAAPNSYTYNVVYKSSNGTDLGSTTVAYKYGTTNTITPPAKSGYTTPSAQSVKWDSTSAKKITFTYTPTPVSATTKSGYISNDTYYKLKYDVKIEHQNRTKDSVQIRVTWTATLSGSGTYNNYAQCFRASVGNASTGNITIVKQGAWGSTSSNTRSETKSSGWITVPLSTTNATSVNLAAYYYQANANGTDMTQGYGTASLNTTWSVALPAY